MYDQSLVPLTFDKYKVVGKDGLNFIPKSTMVHALQDLNLNPPLSELRKAIDDADINGDGGIDAGEFELFVAKYQDTITDIGRCIDNFLVLDTDGSGNLSRSEFRNALRLAGSDSLNDAEFNSMWDSIDVDRSGEISVEEFVMSMCFGATREQIIAELEKRGLGRLMDPNPGAVEAADEAEAKAEAAAEAAAEAERQRKAEEAARLQALEEHNAAERGEFVTSVEAEVDALSSEQAEAFKSIEVIAAEEFQTVKAAQVAREEKERQAALQAEKDAAEAERKRKEEEEAKKKKAAEEAAAKAKAAEEAKKAAAASQPKELPPKEEKQKAGCCG